ncbi:MAG: STAS domain-containing protein [Thermoguttaceae bacterium]|nr:STAS domain-containing protein [Thermoguttaceae bacterium]MDW8077497.1 STAS domain-containing protein [Thermoguttaceae bacterium]
MEIKLVADEGDVVRLKIVDRVVRGTTDPCNDPLIRLGGRDIYRKVVLLDLSASDFVDSSGLSWLLVAHKRFCEAKGQLILHSLTPNVLSTIRMMRLDLVLNLAEDEAQALELARKQST